MSAPGPNALAVAANRLDQSHAKATRGEKKINQQC
jgi:hypothetical protein